VRELVGSLTTASSPKLDVSNMPELLRPSEPTGPRYRGNLSFWHGSKPAKLNAAFLYNTSSTIAHRLQLTPKKQREPKFARIATERQSSKKEFQEVRDKTGKKTTIDCVCGFIFYRGLWSIVLGQLMLLLFFNKRSCCLYRTFDFFKKHFPTNILKKRKSY
jgi:hypothetical protein